MAQLLAVAKYLNKLYEEKHHCGMDQMRMHKMMYFSQRESLMISGKPLFNGDFEAWKYGPVLKAVRTEYSRGDMFSGEYGELSEEDVKLLREVFERYDEYDSWKLSTLSHAESSWVKAREGLEPDAPGNKKMSLSAITVDATKEKLRRKGVVFA